MTERELELSVALLEALSDMGGTPIRQAHLERHVAIKTTPRATPSEVQERLRWSESRGLVSSVREDTGLYYTLTTAGKAWLNQNG